MRFESVTIKFLIKFLVPKIIYSIIMQDFSTLICKSEFLLSFVFEATTEIFLEISVVASNTNESKNSDLQIKVEKSCIIML